MSAASRLSPLGRTYSRLFALRHFLRVQLQHLRDQMRAVEFAEGDFVYAAQDRSRGRAAALCSARDRG